MSLTPCHILDIFVGKTKTLVAYLSQKTSLYSYPMPPTPYDEAIDRGALELYIRYNRTEEGVRLIHHRKVYIFRRMVVHQAPAIPGVEPLS